MISEESAASRSRRRLLLLKVYFGERARQVQVLVHIRLVGRVHPYLRRATLIELLEAGGFSGRRLPTVITASHHATIDLEEWHDKAELLHAKIVALSEGIGCASRTASLRTTAALIL